MNLPPRVLNYTIPIIGVVQRNTPESNITTTWVNNTTVNCYSNDELLGSIQATIVQIKNTVHIHLIGNVPILTPVPTPIRLEFDTTRISTNLFPTMIWSKPIILRTNSLGEDFIGMISSTTRLGHLLVYSSIDRNTFTTCPDRVRFNCKVSYYNPL